MDAIKRQYTRPKGTLIIIGGHEDREGERVILKEVARRASSRKNGKYSKQLVLTAVASNMPEEVIPEYERIFKELGLEDVGQLQIRNVEDAHSEENARLALDTGLLFFTGGDQLRITSQMGVTPVYEAIYEMYLNGGTIVGTSAGAA